MSDPVRNLKASVRCPECRTHFRARIHRITDGSRVVCPTCHCELNFQRAPRWRPGDDVVAYLRRLHRHTAQPHYMT